MSYQKTKQTYENPDVVEKYVQKRALNTKLGPQVDTFAQMFDSNDKKILDLGCGPGHTAYMLAEKMFEVVGLDYSSEMVKRAQTLREDVSPKPSFVQGNMLALKQQFQQVTFDGIFASKSLLHIRKSDIDQVLESMVHICKPKASIYISLKMGTEGTVMIKESVYGDDTVREFTLWEQEEFAKKLAEHSISVVEFTEREGRAFNGDVTHWTQYYCRLS